MPEGIAAIYVRISQDREGAGLGVERQQEDCLPLCLRRGYTSDQVRLYSDNDVSASQRRKPRKDYLRLLEDIHARQVTCLVSWHNDRLHRLPRELEEFIDAVEVAGLTDIEMVKAGTFDLSTASGRLVARLLGAQARYHVEHMVEQLKRQIQQSAEAGLHHGGGRRPYGYRRVYSDNDASASQRRKPRSTLIVDPEEAEIVRDVAERVLLGEPLYAIVQDLNARGVPTVHGGPWRPHVLRDLLLSARISGRLEVGRRDGHGVGEIIAAGRWEAIISVEDSDRLRALLGDPGRDRRRGYYRGYLLTGGLACCGECGARLQVKTSMADRRYLSCTSCRRVAASNEHMEYAVRTAFFRAVDAGKLEQVMRAQAGEDTAAADLYRELEDVDAKLAKYALQREDGELEEVEHRALRRRQQDRRAGLERRLQALQRDQGHRWLADQLAAGPVREAWERWSPLEKRAALAALIDQVVVRRAGRVGRWDPDRVEISWRG